MTTEERDELVALVEALPEDKRRALVATLRRGRIAPVRRPLSPLGPIPAEDADQILRTILEDRERIDPNDW